MSFIQKLTKGADKRVEMPIDENEIARKMMENPPASPYQNPEHTAQQPPRPTRVGEMAQVPYIDNTLSRLNTVAEAYRAELSALITDIAKLTEDKRQLVAALNAVEIAIENLIGEPLIAPTDSEPTRKARTQGSVEVEYAFNEGINSEGKPALG